MTNRSVQWHRKVPVLFVCAAIGASIGQAHAQALAEAPLPEVLVTAQRTSSLASRTPVAMTVLSGQQLQDAAIDQPSGLGARLPNVHLDGASDGLRMTIRGVSNADSTEKGDPSAAFMLDGINIARPQIQNISLFDVARVEVLRGPQGTLYGRNTTAGVVNVIANTPGKLREGALSAGVGNYASRKASAMLNLPVNDALAVRAALAYNQHDSYLINGQGTGFKLGLDRDDVAARLSARLAVGQNAVLLLRADRSTLRQHPDRIVPVSNFYTIGLDGSPAWKAGSTDARLSNRFVPPNAPLQQGESRAETSGAGAQFDWNLGPLSVHYLGAQRKFDHDYRANYHYGITPVLALGVRESFSGSYQQYSHELRVATTGQGPLTAQAGLYYFREESAVRYSFRDLELLGLPPYYVFPQDPVTAVAKAVFGQATWRLDQRLRVTAGARYSDDAKSRFGATQFQLASSFNPATDQRWLNAASLNTHKITWRLGAEFDPAPGTLLFATVSTGYKAGGFNDGCLAGDSYKGSDCPANVAVPAGTLVYQPETLTSCEAGIKTRFWGGKASLNASAFFYDYANLQLSGVLVLHGAPRFMTSNAAEARVRGLEVEGQVQPFAAGRISYALSLLDAHYAVYTPSGVTSWAGRKLDRSPSAALTLGYDHTFRLDGARLQAGMFSRASRAYTISVPSVLLSYQVPSRTQSDLRFSYRPERANWSLHAHVNNLEDKVQPIAIDSFGMVVPSDPMTFGMRLDLRF